jgi:hypothetical protein
MPRLGVAYQPVNGDKAVLLNLKVFGNNGLAEPEVVYHAVSLSDNARCLAKLLP